MKTKPKKPSKSLVTLDYQERASAMKKTAATSELKVINKSLAEFSGLCKSMGDTTVNAVNKSREIGLHLIALSGHEQLSLEFWQKHCEGNVGCSFDQAKKHVALAHKMPQPAKTLDEAAPHIQGLFFAADLIESPVRTESQHALGINLFQKFLHEVTTIRQTFDKSLREHPMVNWKAKELDSFLADTEYLSVQREQAQIMRGKMYRE